MKLKDLFEDETESVELIGLEDPEAASNAWPNVTYKGMKVIDLYLKDTNMEALESALGDFDKQESFLGYVPSEDIFVCGFDVWGKEGNEYFADEPDDNMVIFKFNDVGAVRVQDVMAGEHNDYGNMMMYPEGLKAVEARYPDLIGIRYD